MQTHVFHTQTTKISDEGERFNDYRPLLFSIAYRMLGSAMDAEDIVQEAFLRWQQRDRPRFRRRNPI